ncbi:putative plastid-lipid-associated protein 4, chloroplastic isoform X2 [Primulina tabacum]|uniref:putative plastid-lipid-associated protein 4, chloroplastic isoform X2 n=1 Tax=Primulina tabacum TaxID=48773 RepID=UPI003F590B0A
MPTLRFPSSFPPLLHNSPDFRLCQHQSSPKPFHFFSKKWGNEVPTHIHCPQLSKSWKWRDRVSFISSFLDNSREIESLKQDLLEAIVPLDRGAAATPEDQQRIELRPKLLRPNGKIYQAINVDTLRAQNMETWPFFNQATANLVPLNEKRAAVKFDSFKIAALIPVKSRGSGRGQLEITYLDDELRVSRGNQGNLFILRMADPNYGVPL